MIDKGMISAVGDNGKTATVVPAFSGASVTFPLVVPFFLAGSLTVKMPVVYATFRTIRGSSWPAWMGNGTMTWRGM